MIFINNTVKLHNKVQSMALTQCRSSRIVVSRPSQRWQPVPIYWQWKPWWSVQWPRPWQRWRCPPTSCQRTLGLEPASPSSCVVFLEIKIAKYCVNRYKKIFMDTSHLNANICKFCHCITKLSCPFIRMPSVIYPPISNCFTSRATIGVWRFRTSVFVY